ncbi:MAG: hypothetical protein AB7R89_16335 [Dehalococcoidia bacterium]
MNYTHAQPRPRIEGRTRPRRRSFFQRTSLIWLMLADAAMKATLLWLFRPAATLASTALVAAMLLVSGYLVTLMISAIRRRDAEDAGDDAAPNIEWNVACTLLCLCLLAIPFAAGCVLGGFVS